VLLRLDNEASLDRQTRTRESIAAKEQQLALKKVELQRYLNLNETEQAVLRQNLGLETEILDRLEVLEKRERRLSCSTCSSAIRCAKFKVISPRAGWTASAR
jgi:hypothetical protein